MDLSLSDQGPGRDGGGVSGFTTKGPSKATLKKKFVSCVAGDRNYGQPGGREMLLVYFRCFFFGKKMMKS